MEFETIIGLEVHVQLLTRSKMFCSCQASYQTAPPNSLVCPVCLGMPGSLPVINKTAVEYTIMTGLALNCRISGQTKFDRKTYPYPDLMKGYQISQYDNPIAYEGCLEIEVDGGAHKIGVTRVHLEEDVAKLQHIRGAGGTDHSLVDVNRSGAPLMEVVSEPDMRSPEQANRYLITLHSILRYLGVSTGNMQDGSFRCDANVSIRPTGTTEYMPRVEVKNMNSFRGVYNALIYEVDRQAKVVEAGGRVAQETRGLIEERGTTVSQRSKEHAHDYRYFPEPDLPPLVIDPAWVSDIEASLPELPVRRRDRFMEEFGLSRYDAGLLTSTKATADYFEESINLANLKSGFGLGSAKIISNWITVELARLLNLRGLEIEHCLVTPGYLVDMLELLDSATISTPLAKTVLEESFETGKAPGTIVKEGGYVQISDSSVVESAVKQAIDANAQAVADYLKGKETAAKHLVGQVMKITQGKANPALVNDLVKDKLDALKTS